jgi:DNA-directed RNA polymerase subunit omega
LYNCILQKFGVKMARITSEEAVTAVGNRYDLVLIASRRVRELRHNWAPHVTPKKGENATVLALREIEQGYVGRDYLLKNTDIDVSRHRRR